MQSITLAGTHRETSRLGFGCSSVMGVLGRAQSLAMLESAFDAGIRHFDVAPSYGWGQAEECVGEFLTRHRGEITVTTKYGVPSAHKPSWMGIARKIAQPVLRLAPGLKKRMLRAATSAVKPQAPSRFMAQQALASLEASLRHLKTDRIDLWLMHEASASDLQDEALLRLLEDKRAEGIVGDFGIGSGAEKMPALIDSRPQYCRVLQYEWSVFEAAPAVPASSFRIHHRVLTERFRALWKLLQQDAALRHRWSEQIGKALDTPATLSALMLRAALLANPDSIILFSSKDARHIQANAAIAGDTSLDAAAFHLLEVARTESQAILERMRSDG